MASARSGKGKLVFVHGEAGIGKARLCQELRATQDRRRTQVIAGRADPGDGATMLSAVADSLRAARRTEPDLWAAVQHRQEMLGAVVPEVVGRSPGRTAVERPLLFEALLEVVEEASGDRATVWFLEDLHWADPSTWDFVVCAARRGGDGLGAGRDVPRRGASARPGVVGPVPDPAARARHGRDRARSARPSRGAGADPCP
ncbi:MAG: ATP-binding protein [Ilumatobacteraceae bacterium]